MADSVARIAVVEDDPAVRMALQQLLTAASFDASTFASAEEFLASGRHRGRVDCVIADVHLPGMNGVALLQTLAAGGDVLPAVLITARDDAATLESIRQAGPTPHLHKPFSDTALFDAIFQALGA